MSYKYNGAPYTILSDTFDQWRMKTNEWLSMTNDAGSSNFIKLNKRFNPPFLSFRIKRKSLIYVFKCSRCLISCKR